jgi:hypothetical protein
MSAILPNGEIKPRRPDCLADETVSGEPVWAANSLLSGKITGNFRDYGSNLKVKPKICTNLQPLIDKFPVKANREFFCENRVFFSQNREPRAANREWAAGLAESCSRRRSNLRGVLCAPCDRGRESSLHQRRLSRNQPMNKIKLEPSKTPPFAQIADLIAGPHTPAWLSDHLRRWADSVSLDRAVEKFQPSKAEMRELLLGIVGAAEYLQRAVAHPAVREFLESPPAGPIENIVLFDRNLRDLADRAESASKKPSLTNEAGKTKAGRGRAMPPEAASPQIYCAMLISETWKHFHRRYPGVHNRKAAEAAHIYWLTCGKNSEAAHWRKLFSEGKSGRRKGSDPLSRWRPYFKTGRPPALPRDREKYVRSLVEAERQAKLLGEVD